MLILAVMGLTFVFSMMSLALNRHRIDSLEKTWDYLQYSQARNCATTGVYMALHELSFDEDWTTGFTNLALNQATADVTIEDETTNASLSSMERIINSIATFDDVEKTVRVHVGIPPDLADLAVYCTGDLTNVDVRDESNHSDTSLAYTNMPFMVPYDFDALEALAESQGHVENGYFAPDKNYPNGSFYYSGSMPNVTKVLGDFRVRGGRTVHGIFVVYGNVYLEGSARLNGVITLPNPGTIVMHGGGSPKESSVTGGIFANGDIDGTGNHISVRYDREWMTVFAQFQLQRNLYIISWLESPDIMQE